MEVDRIEEGGRLIGELDLYSKLHIVDDLDSVPA